MLDILKNFFGGKPKETTTDTGAKVVEKQYGILGKRPEGAKKFNLLDILFGGPYSKQVRFGDKTTPSPTPTTQPKPVQQKVTPTTVPTNTPAPTPQAVISKFTGSASKLSDYVASQIPDERVAHPQLAVYGKNFLPKVKQDPIPETVDRQAAIDVIRAARESGIPERVLLGLAFKETGLRNIPQHEGGAGRGIFQYDSTQRPDIPDALAYNPYAAAKQAAHDLKLRMQQTVPGTDRNYSLEEAIASWNVGPNVYSGIISPYYGVPISQVAKQYATDAVNYMTGLDWDSFSR